MTDFDIIKAHDGRTGRKWDDWYDSGDRLVEKFAEHQAKYRLKICAKCGPSQRKKRHCVPTEGADRYGSPMTYCEHMNRATHQRFRHEINDQIAHAMTNMNPNFGMPGPAFDG